VYFFNYKFLERNQIAVPFTFCPKSAGNGIWTSLLSKKKLLLPLPSASKIFRQTLQIGETNVFGRKSVRN